jgi:galacturan 1,4-alpha-galacturonidase
VENIRMINSPEWHNLVRMDNNYPRDELISSLFQVNEGKNIVYNNITINAVSTSSHGAANTDGWNVYRSDNVVIQNSVITNGDDCVAFKPSKNSVNLSDIASNMP